MATKNEKLLEEEIQLLLYKHYHTFQGIYDVCSTNLSVHNLFLKTILHCVDWIKERIGKDKIDEYSQLQGFNKFPKPEEYAAFDINEVKDFQIIDTLEVRSLYVEEEKGWTFRVTEPGNGMECSKYPNRVYITNLSVYEEDESVKFAIRITCKEPETNEETSDVPLPQIVRRLYMDEDFLLKESNLPDEYMFSDKPIVINGKQKEACRSFVNDFYFHKDRQMPILLCPMQQIIEVPGFIEQLNQELVGMCHVVMADNGYNKLFGDEIGKDQEILDTLMQTRNYVFLSGKNSIEQDGAKHIIEMNWINPKLEHQIDEDAKMRLIKSACKELRARIILDALTAQKFKKYDFQGYKFYKELRRHDNYKKIAMGNPDIESETVKQLKEEILALEQAKEENIRENQSNCESIVKLIYKNNELEHTIKKITSIQKVLEDRLDLVMAKNEDLRQENRELQVKYEGRTPIETKDASTEDNGEVILKEIWEPLVNIPISEGKVNKDGIIDWIKEYYSDTIVLHDRAIDSFKKDKRGIDFYNLCLMINYLSGYTKSLNKGGCNILDKTLAREYDVRNKGYNVDPSTTGEATETMFKDKYHIEYEGADGRIKEEKLDLHIRSGGGRDVSCIAIYFHYDSELKKSYIGHFPEHLPTRENRT